MLHKDLVLKKEVVSGTRAQNITTLHSLKAIHLKMGKFPDAQMKGVKI